jgi:hypothetical protein
MNKAASSIVNSTGVNSLASADTMFVCWQIQVFTFSNLMRISSGYLLFFGSIYITIFSVFFLPQTRRQINRGLDANHVVNNLRSLELWLIWNYLFL